mmetsp:Transcript_5581/g.8152  ORF Transcript_5581/g.8152 Transcript_5581/m.8152 type:complete len:106 (-) Transcript_5581:328-645(-)
MPASNASCLCTKQTQIRMNLVKLYFSAYTDADSSIDSNRSNKPLWATKPNMMGLFNMVKNMRQVGIPRSLWEGGKVGEGLLPNVKNHIHGLWQNWHGVAMTYCSG